MMTVAESGRPVGRIGRRRAFAARKPSSFLASRLVPVRTTLGCEDQRFYERADDRFTAAMAARRRASRATRRAASALVAAEQGHLAHARPLPAFDPRNCFT
jgi:hypothetical protein